MLESWTLERFEMALNSHFEIEIPDTGNQSLELVELARYPSGPAVSTFSAIFRGLPDQPFGQGMYLVRHASLGEASLFLVPIARAADGMRYEAVFSRMLKPI